MADEKSKLEKLKENYSNVQAEHDLPDFDRLNEDFHVEKLADSETDFLIREIRRAIGDKIANYLRFCETMLNPSNAGMFVFSMVKATDAEGKIKITDIYKKLSKLEIDFIGLDTLYSEEDEIRFIRDSFSIWQEVKTDLMEIINNIRKNWDNKIEGASKQYFG